MKQVFAYILLLVVLFGFSCSRQETCDFEVETGEVEGGELRVGLVLMGCREGLSFDGVATIGPKTGLSRFDGFPYEPVWDVYYWVDSLEYLWRTGQSMDFVLEITFRDERDHTTYVRKPFAFVRSGDGFLAQPRE